MVAEGRRAALTPWALAISVPPRRIVAGVVPDQMRL